MDEQEQNRDGRENQNPIPPNNGNPAPLETDVEAKRLAAIAAALPPRGDAATQTHAGGTQPRKFREGRPCSATKISQGKATPCGNCSTCDGLGKTGGKLLGMPVSAKPAPLASQVETVSAPEQIETDSRADITAFRNYGQAGFEFVSGIVEKKIRPVKNDILRTVPVESQWFFKTRLDGLRVAEDKREGIELFWSEMARIGGAPPEGGILLHGFTLHYNLFRGLSNDLDDIKAELAKLAARPA